jgi:hypothetical protein
MHPLHSIPGLTPPTNERNGASFQPPSAQPLKSPANPMAERTEIKSRIRPLIQPWPNRRKSFRPVPRSNPAAMRAFESESTSFSNHGLPILQHLSSSRFSNGHQKLPDLQRSRKNFRQRTTKIISPAGPIPWPDTMKKPLDACPLLGEVRLHGGCAMKIYFASTCPPKPAPRCGGNGRVVRHARWNGGTRFRRRSHPVQQPEGNYRQL